ncbi:helix-turn-helix domain-containing protein [Actinomadura litoris]|uniref:Excisionase family DNA-binding protein n=1 Tax=Actinomadura litoris TaxID=2678616 RepID=A0A7K1L963_9ACTN|nr:helix-turn-helix domain-containing protein [Actinomadura litoris]MUN40873.1 excisionase family DNA-binding protein [Actinomadura litoris]
MGAPKPQVWFSLDEAAEFIGLEPRKIQRLVKKRMIPHYRPSGSPTGQLRFHRDDLTDYMASCRVEVGQH